MRSNKHCKGNATIFILLVITIGAVVAYFYSDIFKAKADETAKQVFEWTPENIQKNPVGYLTWARVECNKYREKLLDRQLSVKNSANGATRTIAVNEAEITRYSQFLNDAKSCYRVASEKSKWPVSLNGLSLSEDQLKRRIVEAFQFITQKESICEACKMALRRYERMLAEIQMELDKLTQLKNTLNTDLELAKIKQSFEQTDEIANQVNVLIDTSQALTVTANEPSLDDLIETYQKKDVNDSFSLIMSN